MNRRFLPSQSASRALPHDHPGGINHYLLLECVNEYCSNFILKGFEFKRGSTVIRPELIYFTLIRKDQN